MKKVIVLSAILASLIPLQASAVEGYKSLKFGMTEKEVLAQKLCTFTIEPAQISGLSMYGCNDLDFGNTPTPATAYFIDGKLRRFGIELPWDGIGTVANGLNKKYGASTSASSKNQWLAIDNEPNAEAFIAWENRTLYIHVANDNNMNKIVALFYTDPDFDRMLSEARENTLGNDL